MLQPERPFGMHILLLDRMHFVPEREPARDDQSDENADQKEPAISRQRDQQNGHDRDRNGKPRRSLQAESSRPLDSGSSASILDPPNLATMRKKSRNQKKQAWRCR